MKTHFIRGIRAEAPGTEITLMGWIGARRNHKNIIFWDMRDSTGSMQVTVKRSVFGDEDWEMLNGLLPESSVVISGLIAMNGDQPELQAHTVQVISAARRRLQPDIRSGPILDPSNTDFVLRNRHLYLRHPAVGAVLRVRDEVMFAIRNWFHENRFVEITAPVLTRLPLYHDGSAIGVEVHGEDLYMTQCVGFYLEASAHAFERVYNMGPSFRGEESRSPRHLMEYWHIKAEWCWDNLDDSMRIVEELLALATKHIAQNCTHELDILRGFGFELCTDAVKRPYPRVSYREVIDHLQQGGHDAEFGKSLGGKDEELLAEMFGSTPVWVTGIPRSIEPFPYSINRDDPEVTMTADLVSSNGCGELLGVAEKIVGMDELRERMSEKGLYDDPDHAWIQELRDFGPVPHVAFGMGVERLIRWLLDIPHVRDAIPFPRTFRRKVYP